MRTLLYDVLVPTRPRRRTWRVPHDIIILLHNTVLTPKAQSV